MAEGVLDDILEKIFLRLAVKDIIQCKSVCKSWFSVISSSTFVNSQLTHNNTARHTRIIIQEDRSNNLVGSSNGLVCIFNSDPKLCVFNPCTRERKIVKHPYFNYRRYALKPDLYGFGYDSTSGDYKVILCKYMGNSSRFYLLSLKSNYQNYFEPKLSCVFGGGSAGILCDGALHWLMRDQNHNPVILSFHLSTEEFKEIPPPADARCKLTYHTRLGIIEECLCIFDKYDRDHSIWVIKNYNDIQSWELLPPLLEWDEDIIQDVKVLKVESYNLAKTFFYRNLCLSKTLKYISAPVFVQSLVSPHFRFNNKQKRGRRRRRFMFIKEDPPIHGKKARV